MNVIPQGVKDGAVGLVGPVARALIRSGVLPNTITTIGTLLVIGSGVAFGYGAIRLGGALLLISGIFDVLDGQVARQGGLTTTFGAFYDSTLDRVGEGAVFSGLIFYFLSGPLSGELKIPAIGAGLVALVSSLIVSYARARAEGLGLTANVGIAERSERMVVALVSTGLAGIFHASWIQAVGLWALAAATLVTVAQRMIHVHRQVAAARGADT